MGTNKPFYAFRLDNVLVKNPRGKIPDNDIVTFGVVVNQVDRGHGGGFFPDMPAGSSIPAKAVIPSQRDGMSRHWVVGPMEIAPGDQVSIVYTGTNTSDSELDLSQQAEIVLKIADSIVTAAIGAADLGAIESLVSGALGAIGDPVGKFIGYEKQGPCNGPVFADGVGFSGAGLAAQTYGPPGSSTPPDATAVSFTRPYADEANHNSDICGDVAHTDITFSVLQVPYVSLLDYDREFLPPDRSLKGGLKQFAAGAASTSVRSLLRIR